MMAGWDWLTQPESPYNWRFIGRVLVKAALLFVVLNVAFALLNPLPLIGHLTIYNWLVPGRDRLPYGEDPRAYNLSLDSLDAMFASHKVARPKAGDEFRVLIVGDSATWGILLKPGDTVTGNLNAAGYTTAGRIVRAYNIGHPIMSLAKDLMLLDCAMQYQPDLIVWLTTLESFPRSKQLYPPIVQNNAARVRDLIQTYQLDLDPNDDRFVDRDFIERTIIGQRRPLADWLRLQLYGVMWATTGIDQYYPDTYEPRSEDFEADITWQDYTEPKQFTEKDLAFDVIAAGQERAGDVPVLLINEPLFISSGRNSDLRYNFWYPRWAYDSYRQLYGELASANGWLYLDLWDIIDPAEFTDSPVHLTPAGSKQLSERVGAAVLALANGEPLPGYNENQQLTNRDEGNRS